MKKSLPFLCPLLRTIIACSFFCAFQSASAQTYTGTYNWTDGVQTATRGWTLYVPEGVTNANLRSLVIFSNGSGEDRRFMPRTPWVQAFCRAHNAAAIGFELDVPRSGNSSATTANLQNALSAAATTSGRASLVNAPLLPLGMSFGGINSSVLAAQMPARVIGFAANKGVYPLNWINNPQTAAAAEVPAIMMPGETDGNSVANANEMQSHFLNWRTNASNSGRIGYAIDYNSGHNPDTGQSWDFSAIFLSEVHRLRHPGTPLSTTPGTLPTLNSISLSSGWLAERATVSEGRPSPVTSRPQFPQIAAFASYSGSPTANSTSWVPTEATARAYQAFTSTDSIDIDRTEAPLNQWLQIETPARHQQFRVGETPWVTLDARRWSGSLNFTYRHFRNGSLVTSTTTTDAAWQTGALAAGFHAVIVEATDGTSTRAAFVTFTAEDATGVPTNTWVGTSGSNGRDMAATGAWTDGFPTTTNRRMTSFNAATAVNTDYATNGDIRSSTNSLAANAYFYGFDFPNAPGVSRGWQIIGSKEILIGPAGITNRDANTVTFSNAAGRIRPLTSQTWSAEGGNLAFPADSTNQITLGAQGDDERGRNIYLTLHAASGRSISITTPIVGNGGLVKTGPGTATLDAANTFKDPIYWWDPGYQETIRVHEGTLAIGSSASFADTNRLFVAAGNSATFNLGGRTLTLAALTGGGTVALGTGGSLTLQHKYEESVGNNYSVTDWRGTITGGSSSQDALVLNGTQSNVDSDSDGSAANLSPSGTADMILAGTSTFSGYTRVTSGNLLVASNHALGATGSGNETLVASGAKVLLSGSGLSIPEDFTFNTANNATTLSNAIGSNTLSGILRFPNVESAATNLDTLLLNEAASTTLTLSGTLQGQDWTTTGMGKTRLFLRGATNTIFNLTGTIANGSSGVLNLFTQKNGSTPTNPTFRLAGTNTFTGTLTHLGGTLLIAANAPSGAPGALGNSTGAVTIGASWGTTAAEDLAVLTEGNITVARNFTVAAITSATSTVTLGASDAASPTFSGTITANRSIALTAPSGAVATFGGVISGGGAVTKTGAGTILLNAVNTYSGGTTIAAGSLGGTGTIPGNVTVSEGAGLAFAISTAAGSHDKLDITGSLNLSANDSLTLTVPVGGTPAIGTYTLLTAGGGITGTINTLNLPSGWSGSLEIVGNDLRLVVSALPAVPSSPSTPSATPTSQTVVNLSWADVTGETGYLVQRSTTTGSGFITIATLAADTTSYSDTGLSSNTTYYYQILAANTGGVSAVVTASATTLAPLPAAPSALSATAFDATTIDLAWTDNAANETGFKIERSTTSGSGFTQIATVGANVTSYRDSGLSENTTYFYRVRATNSGGDSAYTIEAADTTPASPPAAPSALVATAADHRNIDLAWADNASNETGFKIERSATSGSGFTQIATVGANITTYRDSGLTPLTTYFYRIRATNSGGDSAYTAEASTGTTQPILAYEGFDYPSGAALTNQSGGFGWSTAWALNSGSAPLVAADGLALGAVATDGLSVTQNAAATSNDISRNFSSILGANVTSGSPATVWVSFLYKGNGNNSTDAYLGLTRDSGSDAIQFGRVTGSSGLRLTSNITPTVTGSSKTYDSTTRFVVLRVDLSRSGAGTGTNIYTAYWWDYTGTLPSAEPAIGTEQMKVVSGTAGAGTGLRGIRLFDGSSGANAQFDELRVGETFASVFPNSATYAAWQTLHWPGYTVTETIGATADPDGDGLANLIEYAFGLDPTSASNGSASLPSLQVSGLSPQPSYLQLTFTPQRVDGLTYTIEASGDLSAWTPADITTLLTPGNLHTHTDTVDLSPGSRRFLRLRISEN